MATFDVLMVLNFFDVLFGFRCSDFRSSDLSPKKLTEQKKILNREIKLELFVQSIELKGCKGVFILIK